MTVREQENALVTVVAKQSDDESIIIGILGGLAVVLGVTMPFFHGPIHWFYVALGSWFAVGGAIISVASQRDRRPYGVVMAIAADGIHWNSGVSFGFSGKNRIFIPWEEMIRASIVTWMDRELGLACHELVIELTPQFANPGGPKYAAAVSKKLEKDFGRPFAENVVVITNASWQRDPEMLVEEINESIRDPASRARWDGTMGTSTG